MKKLVFLLLSLSILASCGKKDAGPVGRDAFIGNYNFTKTYENVKYVSGNNSDTLRGTKTYEIRIEKPNPDDLGADAVVIRGFWGGYPADSGFIIVRVSTDGKSLHFRQEENDSYIYVTTFDAHLNTDKSIDFNYYRFVPYVLDMGYEKGNGKAERL